MKRFVKGDPISPHPHFSKLLEQTKAHINEYKCIGTDNLTQIFNVKISIYSFFFNLNKRAILTTLLHYL